LNSDGSRKQYTDFKFLVDCTDKNPVEDAHEYKLLIQAFNKLGFTPSEIEAIHKMTAATLWLGQVELVDTFDDGKDSKPVTIDKNGPIKEVARLLGINVDDLIVELVNKEKFEGVTARRL
jgi:myosin heavy subunit